jgi:FOG: GAF domain
MASTTIASTETDEREQIEALLQAERRSLELIAGGARLGDILTDLCTAIDAQDPGLMCTVMLVDPDGTHLRPAAGPRIPAEWTQLITPLPIGPDVGTCGAAAYRREPVIVADIATDPLFPNFRDQALHLGLRAAWSMPLVSKTHQVLGTFGMYYREPRAPTGRDLARAEGAAQLAVIAIESERTQAALQLALADIQASEDQLRTPIDTIPALVWCFRPDGTVNYFNQRWHEYTGISRAEAFGFGNRSSGTDVAAAILHPDDAPAILAIWTRQILPGSKPGEFEVRMRRLRRRVSLVHGAVRAVAG